MRVFFIAVSLLCTFSIPESAAKQIAPQGYVNDTAHVLSAEAAQQLNEALAQFARQTGIEIAVVTLDSLEGNDMDDYAVRLFEQWGIGKKETDEGLLIVAAIQEREARIEVGYGLEDVIPDAFAGRVLREVMFPAFRQDEYGQGLMAGLQVLIERIVSVRNLTLTDSNKMALQQSPQPEPASLLVWIFRILLLIGAVILFIKNPFLFFLLFAGMGRGGRVSGGFGGGFGGFGGGLSGGGGASARW